MRIGANSPWPLRGLLLLCLFPFMLLYWAGAGIVKLYRFAWTRPTTTGRKVASVTAVSLGLLILIIIGAASGSPQPPEPASAAKTAVTPVRTSSPAHKAANSPRPAVTATHPVVPSPSYSSPAPVETAPAYVPPATTAPSATQAAAPACSPTTSSGHCYEPGQFCPAADHGMSGVAGDGRPITCEDNNGWRWED